MTYQLYWGDLHSHCSISYGEGTVRQAVLRAREQLDFCSITGHAFWPDMPSDRQRYGEIIDYHREGFARLARHWQQLIGEARESSVEGEFLVLPSYEWHSLKYGDHNVYAAGPELPLQDAPDLPALRDWASARDAIVVPHHIGYAAGYRGIDWEYFDGQTSPIVEIHSLHGCSESEQAPYPLLHDMGPRDERSTAAAGWEAGHRFGVIGSTDHHGGYPGSFGDGRAAIYATALTRQAIWDAIKCRRVYAVTGDKIQAKLLVDDAWPGAEIRSSGRRQLRAEVCGAAAIDCVEILKNDRVLKRYHPSRLEPGDAVARFRLRITWGWGRKDEAVAWQAELSLDQGEIVDVESCFSGQSIVAPRGVGGHDEAADQQDLPHKVVASSPSSVAWRSVTTGNRSTRHSTTQALTLELNAPLNATLSLQVNDRTVAYSLHELLRRGRATYLRGWLSEAIRVGPLEPLSDCVVDCEFTDEPDQECDRYRLRVAQVNGQWAWLSPIWVER